MRPEERTRAALEHSFVAGGLASETAHDYNDQGGEESKCEKALAARLETRDHRRQKDPRGQKSGDNPKQPQLKVPCARQVVWEHPGEVESKEAASLGVVVRCGAAEQGLHQE